MGEVHDICESIMRMKHAVSEERRKMIASLKALEIDDKAFQMICAEFAEMDEGIGNICELTVEIFGKQRTENVLRFKAI